MNIEKRAVLRFFDGRIIKGFISEFSPSSPHIEIREVEGNTVHSVNSDNLKAIFFVRSFKGDPEYRERKAYSSYRPKGNRIYIKFKDDEDMVGFLEGDIPWDKGFFLSNQEKIERGFYILPVDCDSNNIKVFVYSKSVKDVTIVP